VPFLARGAGLRSSEAESSAHNAVRQSALYRAIPTQGLWDGSVFARSVASRTIGQTDFARRVAECCSPLPPPGSKLKRLKARWPLRLLRSEVPRWLLKRQLLVRLSHPHPRPEIAALPGTEESSLGEGGGTSTVTQPARDAETPPPPIESETVPDAVNPAAAPPLAPMDEPATQAAPACLQEGNIHGEGSGYLRPGAVGLASLVLLLLTGVVLLCSDHPVGRGALPNSTDPRGMAPAASSSSAPIVAVDASAPLEVAAGPQ